MVICLTEITLFYHHLRISNKPVSHSTGKYGTGLISNWADKVNLAANFRSPSCITSSTTVSSPQLDTNTSAAGTDNSRCAVYQPRGLELDNEDEILAYLDPELKPKTGSDNYVMSSTIYFLFSLMEIVLPDSDTLET